ncbi:LysR substrate-binding domain-containing protein [Actinomyces polynesiensis]|uniref:LysR substrate-binding domain-containing protein n=1 Tax=Actinomyces polynesiensis TaxID=1325934 RepID=UPI0005BBE64E|nr:LysR substrate-binding domain-containing protein [Actinomyces polynesiensis]
MTDWWPDLRVLEVLVAVPDRGGLGAAARSVGMAQPNASRALAALEDRLGIPLLIRHPRGSTLTPEGEVVAARARDTLSAAEELIALGDALRTSHGARLDVAASMTVAEHLVPQWLVRLRRHLPGADVRLQVMNSDHVHDAVLEGTCDLGFVETPGIRRGLHSRVVTTDRLLIVVPPGHPWSRLGRALEPRELAACQLVEREEGSGTRMTLENALRGMDTAPPALQLGSNAAVRSSVIAGAGPAALSELVVASDVADGTLVEVPVEGLDLRRQIRAVWRGGHPSVPAAQMVRIAAGSR